MGSHFLSYACQCRDLLRGDPRGSYHRYPSYDGDFSYAFCDEYSRHHHHLSHAYDVPFRGCHVVDLRHRHQFDATVPQLYHRVYLCVRLDTGGVRGSSDLLSHQRLSHVVIEGLSGRNRVRGLENHLLAASTTVQTHLSRRRSLVEEDAVALHADHDKDDANPESWLGRSEERGGMEVLSLLIWP